MCSTPIVLHCARHRLSSAFKRNLYRADLSPNAIRDGPLVAIASALWDAAPAEGPGGGRCRR
jgi:hypothetical protein